jgi:hypothetical protein
MSVNLTEVKITQETNTQNTLSHLLNVLLLPKNHVCYATAAKILIDDKTKKDALTVRYLQRLAPEKPIVFLATISSVGLEQKEILAGNQLALVRTPDGSISVCFCNKQHKKLSFITLEHNIYRELYSALENKTFNNQLIADTEFAKDIIRPVIELVEKNDGYINQNRKEIQIENFPHLLSTESNKLQFSMLSEIVLDAAIRMKQAFPKSILVFLLNFIKSEEIKHQPVHIRFLAVTVLLGVHYGENGCFLYANVEKQLETYRQKMIMGRLLSNQKDEAAYKLFPEEIRILISEVALLLSDANPKVRLQARNICERFCLPLTLPTMISLIKDGLQIQQEKRISEGAVLTIGQTGVGKSSLINYLTGIKFELRTDEEYNSYLEPKIICMDDPFLLMGHGSRSKTLYPAVIIGNGIAYNDFPGLDDNRTSDEKICAELSVPFGVTASNQQGNVRALMLVIEFEMLRPAASGRGALFREAIGYLSRLLTNNLERYYDNVLLVVTKLPEAQFDPDKLRITVVKWIQAICNTRLFETQRIETVREELEQAKTSIIALEVVLRDIEINGVNYRSMVRDSILSEEDEKNFKKQIEALKQAWEKQKIPNDTIEKAINIFNSYIAFKRGSLESQTVVVLITLFKQDVKTARDNYEKFKNIYDELYIETIFFKLLKPESENIFLIRGYNCEGDKEDHREALINYLHSLHKKNSEIPRFQFNFSPNSLHFAATMKWIEDLMEATSIFLRRRLEIPNRKYNLVKQFNQLYVKNSLGAEASNKVINQRCDKLNELQKTKQMIECCLIEDKHRSKLIEYEYSSIKYILSLSTSFTSTYDIDEKNQVPIEYIELSSLVKGKNGKNVIINNEEVKLNREILKPQNQESPKIYVLKKSNDFFESGTFSVRRDDVDLQNGKWKISYTSNGNGVFFSMRVFVFKKHTPEGKKEIEDLECAINSIKKEIGHLESLLNDNKKKLDCFEKKYRMEQDKLEQEGRECEDRYLSYSRELDTFMLLPGLLDFSEYPRVVEFTRLCNENKLHSTNLHRHLKQYLPVKIIVDSCINYLFSETELTKLTMSKTDDSIPPKIDCKQPQYADNSTKPSPAQQEEKHAPGFYVLQTVKGHQDFRKNREKLTKIGEELRKRIIEERFTSVGIHLTRQDNKNDKEVLKLLYSFIVHDKTYYKQETEDLRKRTLHNICLTVGLLSKPFRDAYLELEENRSIWRDLEYLSRFCIPDESSLQEQRFNMKKQELFNILKVDLWGLLPYLQALISGGDLFELQKKLQENRMNLKDLRNNADILGRMLDPCQQRSNEAKRRLTQYDETIKSRCVKLESLRKQLEEAPVHKRINLEEQIKDAQELLNNSLKKKDEDIKFEAGSKIKIEYLTEELTRLQNEIKLLEKIAKELDLKINETPTSPKLPNIYSLVNFFRENQALSKIYECTKPKPNYLPEEVLRILQVIGEYGTKKNLTQQTRDAIPLN